MNKLFPLFVFFFGFSFLAKAQGTPSSAADPRIPEPILWPLDSLLPAFHFHHSDDARFDSVSLNKFHFPWDSVPRYSPDVITQRLLDLGSPIRFEYNSDVAAYINMYTTQRREQVKRMLGLQYIYFPIFEDELAKNNMPLELKYLPVIESALNPHARSRVGATGLWQFMLPTGKLYGLDVTSYTDERRDPFKSTEAACRYLREMYKTYKDWLLVIAAYNCGPGNVNKAIRASGGKSTFWEISNYLPKETRGYVPAFIAANYVFAYAAEHNLYPRPVEFSFFQDTIQIQRNNLSLQHLATATSTDFFTLKDLNPELTTNIVPYTPQPYVLRVPNQTAELFAMYRDTLYRAIARVQNDTLQPRYNLNKVSPITRNTYEGEEPNMSEGTEKASAPTDKVVVYYKVKSGDIVGKIAEKYHVTPSQIKTWNHLKGYTIHTGQSLKLYVTEKTAAKTVATAPKPAPASVTPNPPASNPSAHAEEPKYHKVGPGDSLWTIAQKYDGLTVEKLKNLNNLTSSSLKVGQVLRIQ